MLSQLQCQNRKSKVFSQQWESEQKIAAPKRPVQKLLVLIQTPGPCLLDPFGISWMRTFSDPRRDAIQFGPYMR